MNDFQAASWRHSASAAARAGLKIFAAVEMALVVEVVVDRDVNGGEFLQGLDVPEPGHRSVSSAERLG